MSELVEQWERCSKSIQDQVSPAVWQGWLSRLFPLEHRDGCFVFSVPNATIAVKIAKHYQQLIEQTISYELDEDTSVEILVVEAPAQSQTRSEQIEAQQHRASTAATAATLRNGDP
ncbi:MAG: DnaA N-terminal domain-containing protein, partial [Actinomycetes bacterium]